MDGLSQSFPKCTDRNPEIPILCVTPHEGRVIHRFFNTSPFSPSGRYLAAFRMPFEDRLPKPGDEGEVIVVDLQEGEERAVARTKGWEPQLGANVHWGSDDSTLIFNDVDISTWTPHGVRLDWQSGRRSRLEGTIYSISPDGRKAISANMAAMRRTQSGYGAVIPDRLVPRNGGLRDDDGLFITDTESGERRLLISIREAVERTAAGKELDYYRDKDVYCFHCRWNPQGTRLFFTLRHLPSAKGDAFDALHKGLVRFDVYTMKEDGSELFNAIPALQWDKGGHHTTWRADGERLSFNLGDGKGGMALTQVKYDGSSMGRICERVPGSGHPSEHPSGNGLFIADSYPWEPVAYGDGTTPIRLIDTAQGSERRLVRFRSGTPYEKVAPLRLDPHVAWSRDGRFIAFNGFMDGTRRVYVADMLGLA